MDDEEIRTVGDLIDYLDNYGRHLPVVITRTTSIRERYYRVRADDYSVHGEPHVVLECGDDLTDMLPAD